MGDPAADRVRTHGRVLIHPLRPRILEHLLETETDSPSGIAQTFSVELGVASYHVRCLAQAGLLTCTMRTIVRGAIKNHYRLTDRAATLRLLERSEDLTHLTTEPCPQASTDTKRLKCLGAAVRQAGNAAEISPDIIVAEAGITVDYLHHVEAGDLDPPYTTLLRLIDALGASRREFLAEALNST